MALASHLPRHCLRTILKPRTTQWPLPATCLLLPTYYTYHGEVREGELLRPAMRLVMADFLIRHGAITPDNEPDYERIILAMHQERLVM